ncbi:MAG: PHP-associated domain-containing protein [Candidatus Omnitrophota bacterium]
MLIDFHVHSKYSFDCFLEPSIIIDRMRSCGIDGFAVTDHDTIAGYQEFKKLAPDLYIICGEEISTQQGDIVGLFLKEEIKPCCDAHKVIQQIKEQNGLAMLAHPYKWPHVLRNDVFLKFIDCLEVFNARNNIPFPFLENMLAKKAVKRLDLSYVAGSDTHEGFEIGQAATVFDFASSDASDEKIKDAILKKEVKITGREVSLIKEVISHFSRNLKAKTYF